MKLPLLIFFAATTVFSFAEKINVGKMLACESDFDCKAVSESCNDCCPTTAIGKKFYDEFEEQKKTQCGDSFGSDCQCGLTVVECEDGKCGLKGAASPKASTNTISQAPSVAITTIDIPITPEFLSCKKKSDCTVIRAYCRPGCCDDLVVSKRGKALYDTAARRYCKRSRQPLCQTVECQRSNFDCVAGTCTKVP